MMLSPFFCGASNFQQEVDEEPWSSPYETPKKSSKRSNLSRSKNPYSTRGLDKFSALLSDLGEKRARIYSQMGSQDISLVRFVYSNSNDWTPIVVKSRDHKKQEQSKLNDIKDEKPKPIIIQNSEVLEDVIKPRLEAEKVTRKKGLSWNLILNRLRRPSYYLPAVIILILVFLALFGRSAAILCTTLGWYLVPTIKGRSLNSKRPVKKKEYVRRLSENKMVSDGLLSSQKKVYTRRFSENKMVSDGLSSPKSNFAIAGGTARDKSPASEHGHRKSWC